MICLGAAAAVAAVCGLASCGGGVSPPNLRNLEQGVVPGEDLSYYPYVSAVEVIGQLIPGTVAEILFTIVPPRDPLDYLFVEDTLSEPEARWIDGCTFLRVQLRQFTSDSAEPGSGFYRYHGWQFIRHRIRVPPPGKYTIQYWSAVSPEAAGVHRDMEAHRNGALVVRELKLTVPPAEEPED